MLVELLLWGCTTAAAVLARPRQSPPQEGRWPRRLAFGGLFCLALAARATVPFWPLHSNDHAFDDIALALQVPAQNGVARDLLRQYGAAWTALQVAGTHLTGRTHDGLAALSVLFGALALLTTVIAVQRAVGARSSVWLAGIFGALAPVGVRVAHSESPFVVAQLLVAIALLLAVSQPSRWSNLGLGCVVLLLATGHAIGAGYAVGVALIAWSLYAPSWQTALVLAGAATVGAAIDLNQNQDLLLIRSGNGLAILGPIGARTLWRDAAWVPTTWPLLAGVGCAVWVRSLSRPRWPAGIAATLGILALGFTGILPICCASDALRYQAPWMPVVVLALGWSGGAVDLVPVRQQRAARFAVAALWMVLAFQARQVVVGLRALDAQGQTYAALRQALGNRTSVVTWLVPEFSGSQRAYLAAPSGRWSTGGPDVQAMPVDVAQFHCQRYGHLPAPAVLVLEPSCFIGASGPRPCESLRAYADHLVVKGRVTPLPQRLTSTAAEFLSLGTAPLDLEVWSARCPAGMQRDSGAGRSNN